MALPTSGEISVGMINYEKANKVGTGTTVTTSNVTTTSESDFKALGEAYWANAVNEGATSRANLFAGPYGMNEWYGYTYASCVLVGTEILMADRSIKFVEDLVIDDEICSAFMPDKYGRENYKEYNIENIDVISKKSGFVKTLVFDFLTRHWVINNNLKCTESHAVFAWKDKIKSFEWWQARDLEIGDKLVTVDLKLEKITTLKQMEGDCEIVTLGLRDIHTYFANGYLCHQ